jgi:NhaA family Na+:H+ antiporter
LFGVSLLCGIGFTMSLFIGLLAFSDAPHFLEAVKIGILGGSLLAGLLGYYILRVAPRETSPESGREIYGK